MRRRVLLALAAVALGFSAASAAPVSDETVQTMTTCIRSAAAVHRVPAAVLVILLTVEGGAPGGVSQNTNGTMDIGPMQINQIHLPALARRWNTTPARARDALLTSFCANVEAGAWILRTAIDSAGGNFWEGVGRYHSSTDVYKTRYLRRVLRQTLRLQRVALPNG
jgi:hypothetical protein